MLLDCITPAADTRQLVLKNVELLKMVLQHVLLEGKSGFLFQALPGLE